MEPSSSSLVLLELEQLWKNDPTLTIGRYSIDHFGANKNNESASFFFCSLLGRLLMKNTHLKKLTLEHFRRSYYYWSPSSSSINSNEALTLLATGICKSKVEHVVIKCACKSRNNWRTPLLSSSSLSTRIPWNQEIVMNGCDDAVPDDDDDANNGGQLITMPQQQQQHHLNIISQLLSNILLANGTSLTTLVLIIADDDDDAHQPLLGDLELLAHGLRNNTFLKRLVLTRCRISDHGVQVLFSEGLRVRVIPQQDQDDHHDHDHYTPSNNHSSSSSLSSSSLTHLELTRCGISNVGIQYMVDNWQPESPLQRLTLTFNDIGLTGARWLFQALRHHPALHMLDLSYNPDMGFEALTMIGMELCSNHLPYLTHMRLIGCATWFHFCSPREEEIQHSAMQVIMLGLQRNFVLEEMKVFSTTTTTTTTTTNNNNMSRQNNLSSSSSHHPHQHQHQHHFQRDIFIS